MPIMSERETTGWLGEMEVYIYFDVEPFEPATLEYPGYPGGIVINAITLKQDGGCIMDQLNKTALGLAEDYAIDSMTEEAE
jgi:hypothetical protein